MIRNALIERRERERWPRTSGDDPEPMEENVLAMWLAPHERG